jgi:carbon monoxide dehydrogenase subunit G
VELKNEFEVSAPIDEAWPILTDVERIAPCLPGAQLQEVEGDEYRGIVKVKVGPITAQYKGAATFVEKDDDAKRAVLKADGRDTRGAGNASALITAQLEPVGNRTKVSVNTDLTVTGKVAQFGRGVMADVSAKLMGQFADNLEKMLETGAGTASAGTAGAAKTDGAAALAETPAPAGTEPSAGPQEAADKVSVPSASAGPAVGAAAAAEAVSNIQAGTTPTGGTTAPGSTVRKIDSPEPQAVDLLDTAGAPVAKRVVPLVVALLGLFLLWRFRRRKR